jgi:hypothetical protein
MPKGYRTVQRCFLDVNINHLIEELDCQNDGHDYQKWNIQLNCGTRLDCQNDGTSMLNIFYGYSNGIGVLAFEGELNCFDLNCGSVTR